MARIFFNHISKVACSVGKPVFILCLGPLFVLVCVRTIGGSEGTFFVISTGSNQRRYAEYQDGGLQCCMHTAGVCYISTVILNVYSVRLSL